MIHMFSAYPQYRYNFWMIGWLLVLILQQDFPCFNLALDLEILNLIGR